MTILEETTEVSWQDAEKKWIAYFKKQGNYLTNATPGGDTGVASYGRLGKKNSPEHIEKTRLGRIGKPVFRNPESNKRRADGVRRYRARIRKPVYQYALTGEFIKGWESTVDASLGLFGDKSHSSGILVACKKSNSQSGGFLWRFVLTPSIDAYIKPDVHNKGKSPPLHIREKISKAKKGVGWSIARINAQNKKKLTTHYS